MSLNKKTAVVRIPEFAALGSTGDVSVNFVDPITGLSRKYYAGQSLGSGMMLAHDCDALSSVLKRQGITVDAVPNCSVVAIGSYAAMLRNLIKNGSYANFQSAFGADQANLMLDYAAYLTIRESNKELSFADYLSSYATFATQEAIKEKVKEAFNNINGDKLNELGIKNLSSYKNSNEAVKLYLVVSELTKISELSKESDKSIDDSDTKSSNLATNTNDTDYENQSQNACNTVSSVTDKHATSGRSAAVGLYIVAVANNISKVVATFTCADNQEALVGTLDRIVTTMHSNDSRIDGILLNKKSRLSENVSIWFKSQDINYWSISYCPSDEDRPILDKLISQEKLYTGNNIKGKGAFVSCIDVIDAHCKEHDSAKVYLDNIAMADHQINLLTGSSGCFEGVEHVDGALKPYIDMAKLNEQCCSTAFTRIVGRDSSCFNEVYEASNQVKSLLNASVEKSDELMQSNMLELKPEAHALLNYLKSELAYALHSLAEARSMATSSIIKELDKVLAIKLDSSNFKLINGAYCLNGLRILDSIEVSQSALNTIAQELSSVAAGEELSSERTLGAFEINDNHLDVAIVSSGEKRRRGRPKGSKNKSTEEKEQAALLAAAASASGEKRRRGRPKGSKNKSTEEKEQAALLAAATAASGEKRRRGRPKGSKNKSTEEKEQAALLAAAASASGEKRRRGRPKGSKNKSTEEKEQAALLAAATAASGEKRRRGRPKGSKNKSTEEKELAAQLATAAASGEKRRRGRPKGSKNKSTEEKEQAAKLAAAAAASGEKRRRGRPKGSRNKSTEEKEQATLLAAAASASGEKRRRGRPKGSRNKSTEEKEQAAKLAADAAASGEKRRRGRPKSSKNKSTEEKEHTAQLAAAAASGEKRRQGRPKGSKKQK